MPQHLHPNELALTESWSFDPSIMGGSTLSIVNHDGLFGLGKENGILLVDPSKDEQEAKMFINLDFTPAFFTFDVKQDLLILAKPDIVKSEDGYEYVTSVKLHLHKLSKPSDRFPSIICHQVHCSFKTPYVPSEWIGEAHIVNDVVGVFASPKGPGTHSDRCATVQIFSWRTGILRMSLSSEHITSFIFLSRTRILVAHRLVRYKNVMNGRNKGPAINVYDLPDNWQDVIIISNINLQCVITMPPLQVQDVLQVPLPYLTLLSDSSALHSEQPEFIICCRRHKPSKGTTQSVYILATHLNKLIDASDPGEEIPSDSWDSSDQSDACIRLHDDGAEYFPSPIGWNRYGFISGTRTLDLWDNWSDDPPFKFCPMIYDSSPKRAGTVCNFASTSLPVLNLKRSERCAGYLLENAMIITRTASRLVSVQSESAADASSSSKLTFGPWTSSTDAMLPLVDQGDRFTMRQSSNK